MCIRRRGSWPIFDANSNKVTGTDVEFLSKGLHNNVAMWLEL